MANFRTYAVGQLNTVIRRDDNTGAFIDVSPPLVNDKYWDILDIMSNPDDGDHVIAVGQCIDVNGTSMNGVIISFDAGVNWSCPLDSASIDTSVTNPTSLPIQNFIEGETFYEVWFVDADNVWVIGTNGRVLRSTDGGLSFTLYTVFDGWESFALPFTTAIHAISDQVAVVAGSPTSNATGFGISIWKTIDGGYTWNQLNTGIGSTPIQWEIPGGPGGGTLVTGPADGIWISNDEQRIIVGCGYGQAVSYNGGTSFQTDDPGNLEMTQSGKHLTWYPSYVDEYTVSPDLFRHVGGSQRNIYQSDDVGINWYQTRGPGSVIRGAHFYTAYDGYYVSGSAAMYSNDGGISGAVVSSPISSNIRLYAVWTGFNPPLYEVVSCNGVYPPFYSSDPVLGPYVGTVIEYPMGPSKEPNCFTVNLYFGPTPPAVIPFLSDPVTASFADCDACLPEVPDPPDAPNDTCYDLVSCNGTCDDIEGVSGISFPPSLLPGDLYYINGDTTCIYEVYPMRQTFYFNLETSDLYNHVVLAGGDYTIGVTSLLYNGIEQVTSSFSYLIDPVTYQVVQVIGYTSTVVVPNTTENCVDNTQIFLNSVFDSLSLPLEAYSDDPAHCSCQIARPGPGNACKEMFRIQYRDGNIFVITFTITNSLGLSKVFELRVDPGNISVLSDITTPGAETAIQMCNLDVYCPIGKQPEITSIDAWSGDCPVITPPIVEEPCEIVPRLGEPGFSTTNCDPKTVIKTKTSFSESVYALIKRLRYGITTCCEYDLDKIDIKNELLNLGEIYDPTLCVDTTPVVDPCAPDPVEPIPAPDLGVVCTPPVGPTIPTEADVTLTIGGPIVPCDAPDGASVLLTIP